MSPIQQPYRVLRALVGTVVLLSFWTVFLDKLYMGQRPDTLWILVSLAIIVAAGMAVFGRETFQSATDTAKDMKEDE